MTEWPLWVSILVALVGVALIAVPVYRDWRRKRRQWLKRRFGQ